MFVFWGIYFECVFRAFLNEFRRGNKTDFTRKPNELEYFYVMQILSSLRGNYVSVFGKILNFIFKNRRRYKFEIFSIIFFTI